MPALSPTMTTGNLAAWSKKEGDAVSAGDVLAEIETDKAVMEFEASEDGYLAKILVPEGAKDVEVGKNICIIVPTASSVDVFKDFSDADAASAPAAASPEKEIPKTTPEFPKTTIPSIPSSAGRSTTQVAHISGGASPLAKSIASTLGINLADVPPNQNKTNALNKDAVLEYAKQLIASGARPATSAATTTTTTTSASASSVGGEYTDIPNSNVRKVIAARLAESKSTIPHFYASTECNIDALLALRAKLNKQSDSYKISVNDFVVKASACACREVPQVNSAWMGSFIRRYKNVDISVAVDTGDGLITPIVTNAHHKGLREISENIKELSGKAKANKLKPHEFQGGTFTVSNLGMFGVSNFSAIINPPQSCILAVGAGEKKVILDANNNYTLANILQVTLSCDHRSVDGVAGAKWLQAFKKYIEQPQSMLL